MTISPGRVVRTGAVDIAHLPGGCHAGFGGWALGPGFLFPAAALGLLVINRTAIFRIINQ